MHANITAIKCHVGVSYEMQFKVFPSKSAETAARNFPFSYPIPSSYCYGFTIQTVQVNHLCVRHVKNSVATATPRRQIYLANPYGLFIVPLAPFLSLSHTQCLSPFLTCRHSCRLLRNCRVYHNIIAIVNTYTPLLKLKWKILKIVSSRPC